VQRNFTNFIEANVARGGGKLPFSCSMLMETQLWLNRFLESFFEYVIKHF
jgi:hypothetical protein